MTSSHGKCDTLDVCGCNAIGGVWNDGEQCYPNLCDDIGACCINYECKLTREAGCSSGDWFLLTECVDDPVPTCGTAPPTGACCINGTCYGDDAYTEAECNAKGGNYIGPNVPCSENICYPWTCTGGCCHASGWPCTWMLQQDCINEYGVWAGCDTWCDALTCESPPTGACCTTAWECKPGKTKAECDVLCACDSSNGAWDEGAPDCGTWCDAPEWGCCVDDICYQKTEAECIAADGEWFDGKTKCEDCGKVCCKKYACTLKETADACIAIGGRFHEDYTSCATFTCPEWGACCTKTGVCGNNDDPDCNSCTYCCDDDYTPTECALAGGGIQCNKFNPWSTCGEVNSDNCCDDPLIYGACCDYETGICSQQTEAVCNDLNYYYHGDNTICGDIICCVDDNNSELGSCCYIDASNETNCGAVPKCVCDELMGLWDVNDLLCQQTWCQEVFDLFACCSEDWGCYVTTNQICTGNDDLSTTEAACIPNLCDTWMCCDNTVGECNDTLEEECNDANDAWTYGEICDNNECTCSNCGACCTVTVGDCDPTCTSVDSSADCDGPYDTFTQGALCPDDDGDHDCGTSTGACCRFDETCADVVSEAVCLAAPHSGSWNGCGTDCTQDGGIDCNVAGVGMCCTPWGECKDGAMSMEFMCNMWPGSVFYDTPNDCSQLPEPCEQKYCCTTCPRTCDAITMDNLCGNVLDVVDSCDDCVDTCTGSCCYIDTATDCRTCVDSKTKEECNDLCGCDSVGTDAWDDVNLCLDRKLSGDCDTDETGACCFGNDCCDADNQCEVTTCDVCNQQSGYEWQGHGTECSDDACTYACCPDDGGVCSEETEADCASIGTHYSGKTCGEIDDACDRGWCCTGETGEDNVGCDLSNRQACNTVEGYFVADATEDANGAAKQFCDSACKLEIACCVADGICMDPWEFAANDGCILNDGTYDCQDACLEQGGFPHWGLYGTPCAGFGDLDSVDCTFGSCCRNPGYSGWDCNVLTKLWCEYMHTAIWTEGGECLDSDGVTPCDNDGGGSCYSCEALDADGACCLGWKCSRKTGDECQALLGSEPLVEGTNFFPGACCSGGLCSTPNCCCFPSWYTDPCKGRACEEYNLTNEQCIGLGGVPCTQEAEQATGLVWSGCEPTCCGGSYGDACEYHSQSTCEECYCDCDCDELDGDDNPQKCDYSQCEDISDTPACAVCPAHKPDADDQGLPLVNSQGGVCAYYSCEMDNSQWHFVRGQPCGPGVKFCQWKWEYAGSAEECSEFCGGEYWTTNRERYCIPYHPYMWAFMTTPAIESKRILTMWDVEAGADWWCHVRTSGSFPSCPGGGGLFELDTDPDNPIGCDNFWGPDCNDYDLNCNLNYPPNYWPLCCDPFRPEWPCQNDEHCGGQCTPGVDASCCFFSVCEMVRYMIDVGSDGNNGANPPYWGWTCESATGELPDESEWSSCLNVGVCELSQYCRPEAWNTYCKDIPLVAGNLQYLQLPDGRCEWIECDTERGCPYPLCENET